MNVKAGVDATDVHPVLWAVLGTIANAHRAATGNELIVTSLRRPPGARASRHSPPAGSLVTAADLRRWRLDSVHQTEDFARVLQQRFGAFLGVVVEPEWLTEEQIAERGGRDHIDGHIHVELKDASWPTEL